MHPFRVIAISSHIADAARETRRAPVYGHPVHAEVATGYGKHHLVLVVRTHAGDLVLDNLQPEVRDWRLLQYRWVRIQSPANPAFWVTFKRVVRRIAAAA